MRRESLKLWRFCVAAAPEIELSLNEDELRDGGERESVLDRGEETAESLAGSVGGWLLSAMMQHVSMGYCNCSGCSTEIRSCVAFYNP